MASMGTVSTRTYRSSLPHRTKRSGMAAYPSGGLGHASRHGLQLVRSVESFWLGFRLAIQVSVFSLMRSALGAGRPSLIHPSFKEHLLQLYYPTYQTRSQTHKTKVEIAIRFRAYRQAPEKH
jgi:hypothetical protein